ncbi:TIGR01777 family oxidoreductase [Bacillus sp. NTK071]|uniref:TIGR01777 family protein n=1 Tax=Guptibacillus hwajinpoensis TaxID=208199 RepID=A0A4U1MDF3_9BACL|nr:MULTISPECIES: TIGR01777 family oxidoreductase [Bacillaceae]MBN8210637.1 TIGR01777 family oxidoreductase [Bacillus sp. NTK071]TKD68334.1 TIGR01777 family protein [Pseudalkalibacillus hwajinpoensis]
MNIAITGGTGFVGSALTESFVNDGHSVYILTRNPDNQPVKKGVTYVKWLQDDAEPEKELSNIHAIVNLAGESINSGRWTEERKKRILDSRITSTREIISIIQKLEKKPRVLVNASAIGYYGSSLDQSFTENNTEAGNDFLADVSKKWEDEAMNAQNHGVRTVLTRFGIVLGEEGALPLMVLPYKLFIGGKLGDGRQWYSWVHIHDVIGMIRFAVDHESVQGPLNVTAPEPKRMNDFGKTVAEVLNRPHWMPVPEAPMQVALGEKSGIVLKGQCVLPQKAKELGYPFRYIKLKDALENLLV